MKILIIRSFPTEIKLDENYYNQQEIGLATGFLQLGHECAVVYFSPSQNFQEVFKTQHGNIQVHHIRGKRLFKNWALLSDFDSLKKEADLIVVNEYAQFETFKTIKKYVNKTIIYNGPYYSKNRKKYNLFVSIFDLLFLKKYKKLNPLIVTKSKKALDYLSLKGLKVHSSVGVGLDLAQLQKTDEKGFDQMRSKFELLYVGRIEKRRNPFFLLNVLKRLVATDNRYHLTIIGTGSGRYAKRFFETAKKSISEANLTLIQRIPQKNLSPYYLKAGWFLLPTSYEIWGMVLMEAMYYGCAVLTTDNGGSSCLISDQKNGYICAISEKDWFSTITKKGQLAERYANRELIETQYTWTAVATKMINAFEKRN